MHTHAHTQTPYTIASTSSRTRSLFVRLAATYQFVSHPLLRTGEGHPFCYHLRMLYSLALASRSSPSMSVHRTLLCNTLYISQTECTPFSFGSAGVLCVSFLYPSIDHHQTATKEAMERVLLWVKAAAALGKTAPGAAADGNGDTSQGGEALAFLLAMVIQTVPKLAAASEQCLRVTCSTLGAGCCTRWRTLRSGCCFVVVRVERGDRPGLIAIGHGRAHFRLRPGEVIYCLSSPSNC